MEKRIKVTIVSDVVCPWCAVGYKRLEHAIDELGIKEKIEIVFEPFELNPNMKREGEDLREYLSKKYGMSKEDVENNLGTITAHGKDLGFSFDYFEGMRVYSTQEAHILLDLAKKSGKQVELKTRLFQGHFSDRKNISDREEALEILDDSNSLKAIREKEEYWKEQAISSVPTMIFNNSIKMNGAYPVDSYKEVLLELLEKQI